MFEHPYDDVAFWPPAAPRRLGRKLWLVMGGLVLAVAAVVVTWALILPAFAAAGPGSAANAANGQGAGVYSASTAHSASTGTNWAGAWAFGGHGFGLTVSGVSGSTITATTSRGKTVTIHTTSSTTYSRAGQTVGLSAVTKGERIGVRGTRNSDGSVTATRIAIILPGAGGQITAIGTSSITVRGRGGATISINTTSSTKYVSISRGSNGPVQTTIARGSLKVGDFIIAIGTKAGTSSLDALTVAVVPIGTHAGRHGRWQGTPSATASAGV